MNKIEEEFAKLKQFAATSEGWKAVELAFRDTRKLRGFAIEPTSGRYQMGKYGEGHIEAKKELFRRLRNETTATEYEAVEKLVTEARVAEFSGYEFPLILLMCASRSYLELIEPKIIKVRIGLPVGILFSDHGINMTPFISNLEF